MAGPRALMLWQALTAALCARLCPSIPVYCGEDGSGVKFLWELLQRGLIRTSVPLLQLLLPKSPLPCVAFLMSPCPVDGYFTRKRLQQTCPDLAQGSLMLAGGPGICEPSHKASAETGHDWSLRCSCYRRGSQGPGRRVTCTETDCLARARLGLALRCSFPKH